MTSSSLSSGIDIIRSYLAILPARPGVYRMLDAKGAVLYVGKAKSLKKRVTSYTQETRLSLRIQRMVHETRAMEFVETHTEAQALFLETNLIKSLRPTYNILMKDDKMHASILIPADHDFPGAYKHRGVHVRKGDYYGPFLSASAVSDTLTLLHKVFQIRNCSDSYFAARTRPCLQYHIKRCTAPCVGKVSKESYANQIRHAHDFLNGKSRAVQDSFAHDMQAASAAQNYEAAAALRDKIRLLSAMMATQNVNVASLVHTDVIALVQDRGLTTVQVFFFRHGQNYGHASFFPDHATDETPGFILSTFISQFYTDKIPPADMIVSHLPDETDFLSAALSESAGRKVDIHVPVRGDKKKVLDFAVENAAHALSRHIAARQTQDDLTAALQELFDLPTLPQRIEIYDNSHLSGTDMVGAMVVAGPEGFRKNAYRKFNIKTAGAADDYAMMREVMTRRFSRAINEGHGPGTENWPDLVLIDGGPGQLSAVTETLAALGVAEDLAIVAISKGEDRNAGREWFHRPGQDPFQLPINDPVLHYLQRLRDEAHRFAIGSQRARRTKHTTRSALDDIPGIGAARKKALLLHFGSARDVAAAGTEDLAKVKGISKAFATKLYSYFHNEAP